MTNNIELSIILPAYLEEENLRLLLPRIRGVAKEIATTYEILVVDTPVAMDGTAQACFENHVEYLNREGGEDYGQAIKTGIKHARGKYIIFMDADGSHPPMFLKELYSYKENYDIVVASRYTAGGHTENSPILVWMSRIVNWGYRLVLNIRCKDISNSFKLYKAETLKGLTLSCKNFDIVEEIFYKIVKKDKSIKVKEVPFSFKQRMFGKTKRNLPKFVMTYILTLLRLRFMS